MFDIEKYKPDDTGKYSPLLYKWLKHKNQRTFKRYDVYQCHNRINGEGFFEYLRPLEIIIGRADTCEGETIGIAGRTLKSIITGTRGVYSQSFYYSKGFGLKDITEEFWSNYEKIGRCVWDSKHQMHMIGDDKRWEYQSDTERKCNWCGKHQEQIGGNWMDYRSSVQSVLLTAMGSLGEEVQ